MNVLIFLVWREHIGVLADSDLLVATAPMLVLADYGFKKFAKLSYL